MGEAVYTVDGMTCDHCVQAVSTEVSGVVGVTGVDVDLASGRVRVSSDRPLDDAAVRAAVEEAGYQVVS
jgi:copper chaperone